MTPRNLKPPKPSDTDVREAILRFLYQLHKGARSISSTYANVTEIKQAMKPLSIRSNRIATNLAYLVQSRWVEEKGENFNIFRNHQPLLVRRITYRIAAAGIDRFEGPSTFQNVEKMTGINITNVQGITVIGNDNVVKARFEQLFRGLENLGNEVRTSNSLTDKEKLACQTEIETIKSQLMKDEPDHSTIQRAWEGVKVIAAMSSAASTLDKVAHLIKPFLGL